jgi:hypothetical protein
MLNLSVVTLETSPRHADTSGKKLVRPMGPTQSFHFLRSTGFWVFIGSLAFNFLSLFVLPGVPLWTGGDQTIWLHAGQRMFYGDVLYRDFFQMTFPGTELLYFSFFKLFGLRTWIPNALLVFVGSFLAWLIYSISRRVLSPRHALVPSLLFLTLIFHDLLDASHHWFSILACAAALALLIECRTPSRIFFAGLFCGLATCFTQSHGVAVLAGLALFLYLEQKQIAFHAIRKDLFRNYGSLLAGFWLSVLVVTVPFIWKAGLYRFLDCTVVFVVRYFGALGANDWQGYMIGLPSRLSLRRVLHLPGFLLVHALIPLIYVLALLRYFRKTLPELPQQRDRLLLIAVVGLALFLSVMSAPTWARLYYVSFPALILFTCFMASSGKTGRRLLDVVGGAAILLAIALLMINQFRKPEYLDLPGGLTAFSDHARADRYRWIAGQTKPSEYFFGGLFPDFYFLLGLKNPTTIYFVTPDDFTRPQQVANAIQGLEAHHTHLLLWAAWLDLPPDPSTDHLGPLRGYIRSHYCVLKSFPEYEVWVRTDDPVQTPVCHVIPISVNAL